MKKPERESNVDYMYNLHKYIDYIEHKNKELRELLKEVVYENYKGYELRPSTRDMIEELLKTKN